MFLMTLYCICVACKLSSCSQLLITCTECSSRFRLNVQVQVGVVSRKEGNHPLNHYSRSIITLSMGCHKGFHRFPHCRRPTPDEPNDRDVDAAAADDQPAASQDTDLELSERNILAGKRKRTKSTRAVEGTSAGPSKKLSRPSPATGESYL
jgi:hypothetical protein